jgi:hypothetical protein
MIPRKFSEDIAKQPKTYPPAVLDAVKVIENEWEYSATCRTLHLWARDLCRSCAYSGYRSDDNQFQSQVNGTELDRLRSRFKLLDDEYFVLLDAREKGLPQAATPYCGLRVRAWFYKEARVFNPVVRLLTHPTWVSRGLEVHEKIEAYKKSEEFRQAVEMHRIKSILDEAAPESPRTIKAIVRKKQAVPAFVRQTP